MGSFRTLSDRQARDVKTIRQADRPLDTPELDPAGNANWLAEGESVAFWTVLPHLQMTAIVSAGTSAQFDKRGRAHRVTYDPGAAIRSRIVEGIVDWTLFDETGAPVPWDHEKGLVLVDGLPNAVFMFLQQWIGNGAPPDLNAVAPETAKPNEDGVLEGPSVGETSAGS
jgi:hypothetical protein